MINLPKMIYLSSDKDKRLQEIDVFIQKYDSLRIIHLEQTKELKLAVLVDDKNLIKTDNI